MQQTGGQGWGCGGRGGQLRLAGGRGQGRQGGAGGDDPGCQQHDDQDDDQDHHHDHHHQLDVLPPVGASHLLGRLLEVLSLQGGAEAGRERGHRPVRTAGERAGIGKLPAWGQVRPIKRRV